MPCSCCGLLWQLLVQLQLRLLLSAALRHDVCMWRCCCPCTACAAQCGHKEETRTPSICVCAPLYASGNDGYIFSVSCSPNKGEQWPAEHFNITVLAAQQTDAGCWLNATATAQYNSSTAERPEPMDSFKSGGLLCPETSTVGWSGELRNNSFAKVLAVWTDAGPAALNCSINGVPGPITGAHSQCRCKQHPRWIEISANCACVRLIGMTLLRVVSRTGLLQVPAAAAAIAWGCLLT